MNTNIYLSKPAIVCALGQSFDSVMEKVFNGERAPITMQNSVDGKLWPCMKIKEEWLTPVKEEGDYKLFTLAKLALSNLSKQIEELKANFGKERIGVCVGSCDNCADETYNACKEYFTKGSFPRGYDLGRQSPWHIAKDIAEFLGITGVSLGFATACSSSGSAIIKAAELLQCGVCDVVIAGGVDLASFVALSGFASLGAVDSKPCNPFSVNRRGITLGDGAAFFIMTTKPCSSNNIRLYGYSSTCDGYMMTAPEPSGKEAVKAMQKALKQAGLSICDIDYINLHSTGTKANDSAEGNAMAKLLKDIKPELLPKMSGTKALTGHTLGASAALELALCYGVLTQDGSKGYRALPHIWDKERDTTIPLVITDTVLKRKPKYCMSNTFAFGGANVSLIIGT